jgi:hypothetical protein
VESARNSAWGQIKGKLVFKLEVGEKRECEVCKESAQRILGMRRLKFSQDLDIEAGNIGCLGPIILVDVTPQREVKVNLELGCLGEM